MFGFIFRINNRLYCINIYIANNFELQIEVYNQKTNQIR